MSTKQDGKKLPSLYQDAPDDPTVRAWKETFAMAPKLSGMSKPESQPVTKAASGKNAEIHKNHRTRMRERLDADGLHTFHDHEALEMLLYYVYPQGDVNPVAHRLMNKFGCFHRVLEATPDQLIAVEGIGESAARLLHLVFQFCQRYHQDCAAYRAKGIPLKSTKQLAYYLVPQVMGFPYEVTVVACVDSKVRPISCEIISRGSPTASEVDVRHLAEIAMRNSAPAIVLLHNHPRGDVHPTMADINVTKELYKLLLALDVQLIDHIIVADGAYVSLCDYGVFDTPEQLQERLKSMES